MFDKMRRKERELPKEQAMQLLAVGDFGTLSTVGEDGCPYATPLNYVVLDGCIYIHAAREGKKIRNLRHQPQVCFCVVGANKAVFKQDFTTAYESVVVFGAATEVHDDALKTKVLLSLCEKYLPEFMDRAEASIVASFKATGIWKIEIQHITGKANPVA